MSKTVFYIKLIHSLLFFLIVGSTIYVFVTAAMDQINTLTWWAFGITIVELLALLLNNWRCPLTDLAEQHGAKVGSVADLFLPKWLSDYIFLIFGVLFVLTCFLLIWRVFS
ncbi:hypothetical protein [Fodinibius sp. Rm-B-1B1-1]|uniref:hypothetical protein n=1 Tax=Fodinibius alkaliphilus TaxID=3140241 RepID=UPI003159EF69